MPHRWSRRRRLGAALVAVVAGAVLLAACGSGRSAGLIDPDGFDYSLLRGSVRVDGSSTVFPISEAVAEDFSLATRGVRVNVAFSGTGGGFEKFCRREINVADASRHMNDKERAACAAAGITEILEFEIAIDALTVVVNPRNTWATCLTPTQLTAIYKDGGARLWSDIDPSWPAEAIKFYFPGADSGTFDYFKEALKLSGTKGEPSHRSDGTSSEDDNILIRGVEGDKYAIGYFGFAFFQEAGQKLKALEVDNGSGCVAPTFDNAVSGKYKPLSRPLLIYADAASLRADLALTGFLKFYLNHTQDLAAEVGYVSVPDDLLRQQQEKLLPFLPQP